MEEVVVLVVAEMEGLAVVSAMVAGLEGVAASALVLVEGEVSEEVVAAD